jgi:hypothetical protein
MIRDGARFLDCVRPPSRKVASNQRQHAARSPSEIPGWVCVSLEINVMIIGGSVEPRGDIFAKRLDPPGSGATAPFF